MVLFRSGVVSSAVLLFVVHTSAQQPTTPVGEKPAAAVPAPAVSGNAEHGRYIVEQVAMCAECHSARDKNGEIIAKTRFKGGPVVVRPPWDSAWALAAPRIAGLPGYTDELAIRLLTQGAVGRHGKQLRPPMPRFRMQPQDAADVITFLRSLQ